MVSRISPAPAKVPGPTIAVNGYTVRGGITTGVAKFFHISWFCTGHDQKSGVGGTVVIGQEVSSKSLSCFCGLAVRAVTVTLLTSIGKGVGFTTFTPQNPLSAGSSPNGEGMAINISGLFKSSCSRMSSPPALVKSLTTTLSDASLLSTGTPLMSPVALPVNVIVFSSGGSRTQSQKNIVDCEGPRSLGPPKIRLGGSLHWSGLTSNVLSFARTSFTSNSPVFVIIRITVTFSPNRTSCGMATICAFRMLLPPATSYSTA